MTVPQPSNAETARYPHLYHLVEEARWLALTDEPPVYYPPTYDQDGFTHATANPDLLLTVANHFYTAIPGNWICLQMTRESIEATGVKVVFEQRAAVGNTEANFDDTSTELFPHIYGGIHRASVQAQYAVQRNRSGEFLAVTGLIQK